MTLQPAARNCPNCHAPVPRTARQCPACKLEVAKMNAFAAAKLAASRRGVRTTEVDTRGPNPFLQILLRPVVIVPALVLVAILIYLAMPAKAPAWTRLPSTQEETANQFLTHISKGMDKNEEYDAAYSLISSSVHDPGMDDEIGHYRQLFHVMNLYLSGEFGNDWGATMTLEPDKADPNLIIAHIGLETLHLQLADDTPPEKSAAGHHYAVKYINEFDVHDADKMLQMAGIKGFLKGEAGQGAVNNLDSVLGAMGGGGHETHMQTKMRLLPQLRNPRSVNNYEVYQTWPVRKDPVVRNRLEAILKDDRYPPAIQNVAKEVLNDNVSEEELIAAHVNDNS